MKMWEKNHVSHEEHEGVTISTTSATNTKEEDKGMMMSKGPDPIDGSHMTFGQHSSLAASFVYPVQFYPNLLTFHF